MLNKFSVELEKEANIERITEDMRMQPPTKAQIKELNTIFDDFGIKIKLPTFRTFAELDIFRRSAIRAVMA